MPKAGLVTLRGVQLQMRGFFVLKKGQVWAKKNHQTSYLGKKENKLLGINISRDMSVRFLLTAAAAASEILLPVSTLWLERNGTPMVVILLLYEY